jgi:YgiT-type zinc finger domain-containing protein
MALEDEIRMALEGVTGEFLAWNAAHPDATFMELEREMARRLQAVQSEVLTTVLAERSGPAGRCPQCGGGPLTVRTEAERTVLLSGDAPVTVRRPYLVCSACGHGHFPPGRAFGVSAE